jgi:hypothetical protein
VIGFLLQVVIFTSPTTAWYRAVIFGPTEGERQPLFSLGPRVRRLLGWQVGLVVLLIAPLAALWWLADTFQRAGQTGLYAATVLALGTATILVLIAVCRLSMVLALAAADQPASLGAAWRLTRGLGFPILWITGVVSGLAGLPLLPAQILFGAESLAAVAVENILTFISMLAMATLFAQIYLDLRDAQAAAT